MGPHHSRASQIRLTSRGESKRLLSSRSSRVNETRADPTKSAKGVVELSIVTTLYRSAPFIEEFCQRAIAAAEAFGRSFELVLVNDGSPDDSSTRAIELARRDERIVVVDLARNFGHHLAIMAGLEASRGELIFLLDVDLEEHPEWLPSFHEQMLASAAEVVYGVQDHRRGDAFRTGSGAFFYGLFNRIAELRIPHNVCTARLMTRRYVRALLLLRDRTPFLAGNFAWTGFPQVALSVQRAAPRRHSSYTLTRRWRLFLAAITSFSASPLRFIFSFGLAISAVSGAILLGILVRKLLDPSRVLVGWASVMASIWFLGGAVLLACGVIGIYLAMIYTETKHRPRFIVRRVVRHGQEIEP